MIYLECSDRGEHLRRFRVTNEPPIDIDLHETKYKNWYDVSHLDKVTYDTSKMTTDEIVQDLIDKGLL